MIITEWANESRKSLYTTVKQHYKKYISACISLGESIDKLDDMIVSLVFPRIASIVSEDIKEGGTHEIEWDKNNSRILVVDEFTFADGRLLLNNPALLKIIGAKSMLPMKKSYDLSENIEKLVNIISDLLGMSAYKIPEKYPIPTVNMQAFLKMLSDKYTFYRSLDCDETTADVSVQFYKEATDLLYKFVTEYSDEITDELLRKFKVKNNELIETTVFQEEDGKVMTLNNCTPIDCIGMDCECVRENEDDCFRLTAVTLFVYSDEYRRPISEKMTFDNDREGFGKIFDDAIMGM